MARAGNHSIGSLGRFSRVPSHSLQPPEVHLDLTNWESMTLNIFSQDHRRGEKVDTCLTAPTPQGVDFARYVGPHYHTQGFNWAHSRRGKSFQEVYQKVRQAGQTFICKEQSYQRL